MRVVKETLIDDIKVSVLHWNNKYLLKLEAGPFEQTYKISSLDLLSDAEALALLDADFMRSVQNLFMSMAAEFKATMERNT